VTALPAVQRCVSRAQKILLHLAHRVARQFIDEEYALRTLKMRQPPVQGIISA
jgi:hypothetical protein